MIRKTDLGGAAQRPEDEIWQIAIDGPSGSGKSTAAKKIADEIGIDYVDTGAMYRAIALKILRTGTEIDEAADKGLAGLKELLDETEVEFESGRILLDGTDVSHLIRSPEVSSMASKSSALGIVREKLVALQRKMGETKRVVADGRDIGTNVFPGARFKFFLTASPEERARRRCDEMAAACREQPFDEVLADINKRDYDDSHRELNPLKRAEDAILLDTDNMDADQVVSEILKYVFSNTRRKPH